MHRMRILRLQRKFSCRPWPAGRSAGWKVEAAPELGAAVLAAKGKVVRFGFYLPESWKSTLERRFEASGAKLST